MKTYNNILAKAVLAAAIAAGLVVLYGCQKAESAKEVPTENQTVYQSPEQTECPVTGGPVNQNIYTVYKGKKVYFCCEGCKKAFERHPEKYIDKLPQFQQ